jgi:GrpB-like predicted nucleotidyltransferase (UPF0157 family)
MRVEVVPYDAAWPDRFEAIRRQLAEALVGVEILAIEHVGSTSVPGLAAKPVIDIDVIVTETHVSAAVAALERIGYRHLGDLGITGRQALAPPEDGIRRNVYVAVADSLALRNHLGVRDTLRSRSDLRKLYGDLKLRLSEHDFTDIDEYVEAKSDLLGEILSAAGIGAGERDEIRAANRA